MGVRVCVIGGGLAGSLLTWRLARAHPEWHIDAVAGTRTGTDATAASGGAVRAFERHPEQRELAIASILELRADATVREWCDFRRVPTFYLTERPGAVEAEVAEVEAALLGAAVLYSGADLRRMGWRDVPDDAVAVGEHDAGYLSPARLRAAAYRAAVDQHGATAHAGDVTGIAPSASGGLTCVIAGTARDYDLVVLAAGGWTASVLRAAGLAGDGYRTKAIQFAIHPLTGWVPPVFIDEATGLYGRPTADGGLLVGLPTDQWDVDPGHPTPVAGLSEAAISAAVARFDRLQAGPPARVVWAADCYTETPVLRLRPVAGAPGLHTFTGGSGGSAKTVLAASAAAARLVAAEV